MMRFLKYLVAGVALYVLFLIWRFPYQTLVERSIARVEQATGAKVVYTPVRAGIDDFTQKTIGQIDSLELPKIGTSVRKGETLFTLRHGDHRLAVPAPVSGRVTGVNDELRERPELIKLKPYQLGTGFGHLAVGVPDVYKTCEAMRAQGVKITREPGPMKFGGSVIAFVEDPDGYKVELIQRG